jgi:hypothetical protein
MFYLIIGTRECDKELKICSKKKHGNFVMMLFFVEGKCRTTFNIGQTKKVVRH